MKLFYRVTLFSLFILTSAFASIQDEAVLLLSYPRSGNTWTRYCIEYITKRPTGEYPYLFPIDRSKTHMNNPLNNNFDLGVDYQKPPVIKLHTFSEIRKEPPINYLIVVVRDYKECLMRNRLGSFESAAKDLLNPGCWDYIDELKIYNNWDKDKRLLIYYEDLMQNPIYTYMQIADFFNEGEENIDLFLEQHALHEANSLTLYIRDEKFSETRGKDLHFHSKKLTLEQIKEFESICKQVNPEIYDLYLTRYETN